MLSAPMQPRCSCGRQKSSEGCPVLPEKRIIRMSIIHIVADNLSAHKTKGVFEFLNTNPAVRLHYTPTYSSWLNQVEIWFSKIQRAVITRGIFT
jgi:transposase